MEPFLKSNKLKILIISSKSEGGGAEQFFKIISKLKGSFQFYCALPDSPPFYDKVLKEKVPTFKLPYRKFEILAFLQLSKWVKANGITVVHSHGRGAGIYSRLLKLLNTKLKVVHTFHGIHARSINPAVIVELFLKNLTDKFIFVSKSERQIALRLGITGTSKSALIENGIQTDNEVGNNIGDQNSALQSFNKKITNDSFVIGMLSRFDRIKNIPYAIRTLSDYLKKHNNVFLVIGGDGEERRKIERVINECNLQNKVILLGFINDIKRFFLLIDIYLNTSLGEAFGFSTVEAMKYRKPVVASKVYGNTDVVDENKTGLLFSLNKPSQLVEKIKILRNNQKTYDYLLRNARASIEKRFNLERMLNGTRELYLSLIPEVCKRRKTRIGIKASKVFDVHTGIDRYKSNLCRAILKTGSETDYCFYTLGKTGNAIMTNIEGILFEKPAAFIQNNTLRFLWEQIVLLLYSRKDRLDLFHYIDDTLLLKQAALPVIITVHDIAYIRFPWLFDKSSHICKQRINERAIRKADIIIVPSYSTKRDLTYLFGIRSAKIKVICHGVESRFRHISNVEEYRLRNNLPKKMILTVGTLEPRKNIVTLIKAFKGLRERGLNDYKLVVAGDKRCYIEELLDGIKSNNLEQAVLFPGAVRDQDLPLLYNCAKIFVYPSLYEGFGMPPLEAMACGIPVITSNTSSLPEVVSDAGIMVDPTDVSSLCDSMYRLLQDRELWHRMRNMGLERSKLFSWEKAARETLAVYDEALFMKNYRKKSSVPPRES
ncbi:MAG: glycosyltransferase [Bacteriovoracaceae bacterium]|nr:glycosyltransferase [Bacteriovoracaceae bacterium]